MNCDNIKHLHDQDLKNLLRYRENYKKIEEIILNNLFPKEIERECDEVDEREREKLIVQGMKLIVYGLKSWKIGKEREIYRINREDNKI